MVSIRRVAATAMFIAAAGARAATPAPADTDYPGTLKLAVDATDLDHRVFRVRETIPVAAGPLTLFYPQWLPGNHGPRGAVDKASVADGAVAKLSTDRIYRSAHRATRVQG